MLERLQAMGITCARADRGHVLRVGEHRVAPAPFNDAEVFFRRALERQVMTVPGVFFDVNPGKQRSGTSPYAQWVRFSFGPPIANVKIGLDRLESMLRR